MVDKTKSDEDPGLTQRYGALTTGLNEALFLARRALDAHAELLPGNRLGELDTLLEEFERKRVRIALYGEVKAGKSTLINALAGAELSPVAFEPITSIPVRITYGSQTTWRAGTSMVDSVEKLSDLMREGADVGEIVVETELDLLRLGGQVDVLDTPGVGSEERFDCISAGVLRSLDAVVLVVRYPALFTQLTRKLMKGLESDIGKLFVVWNVDAACSELTPDERSRHAETLRAKVVGAHELYLVDARAGFRAAESGDDGGVDASGLAEFSKALASFASSEKRQLVALREAAKRADRWLEESQQALSKRQASLEAILRDARARLRSVEDAAGAKAAAARAAFAEFRKSLAEIADRRAAASTDRAQALRKALRAARWRWIRTGDGDALVSAVSASTGAYADATASGVRSNAEELQGAAKEFGATCTVSPRDRSVPGVEMLSPEDRKQRAVEGHGQMLRRALWSGWYLPGLSSLEGAVLAEDLDSQSAWFDRAAKEVEEAARKVLDQRLEEIRRQAEAEAVRIRAELNFEASKTEFDTLGDHLPTIAEQRERVARINKDTRELME